MEKHAKGDAGRTASPFAIFAAEPAFTGRTGSSLSMLLSADGTAAGTRSFKASLICAARSAAVILDAADIARIILSAAAVICISRDIFLFVVSVELIREELREGSAYLRRVRADFHETCGENAELNRNNDLLFTGYAQCDDQIRADFAVGIDRQIPAETVCGKTCVTAEIAKLCKSRKGCCLMNGRHAHFEETCENERGGGGSDIDICGYRECNFSAAVIHENQIQRDRHFTGNIDALRTEDRSSFAFTVAFRSVSIKNSFGKCAVRTDDFYFSVLIVDETRSGNSSVCFDRKICAVVDIIRIKMLSAGDAGDADQTETIRYRRGKPLACDSFQSLEVEHDGIVNLLYIDRLGDHIAEIAVKITHIMSIAAIVRSIWRDAAVLAIIETIIETTHRVTSL